VKYRFLLPIICVLAAVFPVSSAFGQDRDRAWEEIFYQANQIRIIGKEIFKRPPLVTSS